MARFGIPYMGSKDKFVDKLLHVIPPAENFYDLFGGGFSVSHCALLMKKWKHVHYNEIESSTVQLVKDAIAGKYNFKVFKPDWISRERFLREKDLNAYIRICWSFGNNQKSYLFGKDIEDNKRSLHQAVIFDEFDSFALSILRINKWPEHMSFYQRRLYCRRMVVKNGKGKVDKQLQSLQQLERLQQLQQLERLQQLEQLQRLTTSSLSYDQVEIKPNSIIYCDPPYAGTAEYTTSFDSKKFFEWAHNNKNPVFISEFAADSRFKCVFQKERAELLSGGQNEKRSRPIDKLFVNAAGATLLTQARFRP